MSQPVIRFENVGKLYRLGTVGTGTISHDLHRWWVTSVLHKEDPYLKIGETNDRSTKGTSDYVYALKDINLDVQEGEVLGIIGKNGAGKSTLLKLLSRVTAPTTGKIYTRGRIASLLEVGTGFHPELTGRENIYMNGCILGMKRHEIDRKLDEIVDFSGCERYIDTPVKRYSSGMMVRLGFSVAAHLEPEILLVDEVLAVGDAEFQKKAIGKMQDVSKGQGRTVLFVSHNMAAVRNLCRLGVLLENGVVKNIGDVNCTVDKYLALHTQEKKIVDNIQLLDQQLQIDRIKINNSENDVSSINRNQETLHFEIAGKASNVENVEICLIFKNNDGAALALYSLSETDDLLSLNGKFFFSREIQLPDTLHQGLIKVDLHIHQPNVQYYLKANNCCFLQIEGYIPTTGQIRSINSGFITLTSKQQ